MEAVFDDKGFIFTEETQNIYNKIKSTPHLYVAYSDNYDGFIYIGKSFQNGGRWKKQHAYHLGSLAYHLLNCIRYDDQNHQHWIKNWMLETSLRKDLDFHRIKLRNRVFIALIPFETYSSVCFNQLNKSQIKEINSQKEKELIASYKLEGVNLLNINHNRTI